jgi:hypothetical protein
MNKFISNNSTYCPQWLTQLFRPIMSTLKEGEPLPLSGSPQLY